MSRLDKYRRKIDYILDKIAELPRDLNDEIIFDAVLYRIHTSIEAAMDIIAMLVKDLGKRVSDDYSNIEKLEELNIIDKKLANNLKKLNGLRNIIVHRYNKLDRKIIAESLDEITDILLKFLDVVDDVLRENFGGDQERSFTH